MAVETCLLIKIKTTKFCLLDMLMQLMKLPILLNLKSHTLLKNQAEKVGEKKRTNLTHSVALYTFQEFRLL